MSVVLAVAKNANHTGNGGDGRNGKKESSGAASGGMDDAVREEETRSYMMMDPVMFFFRTLPRCDPHKLQRDDFECFLLAFVNVMTSEYLRGAKIKGIFHKLRGESTKRKVTGAMVSQLWKWLVSKIDAYTQLCRKEYLAIACPCVLPDGCGLALMMVGERSFEHSWARLPQHIDSKRWMMRIAL